MSEREKTPELHIVGNSEEVDSTELVIGIIAPIGVKRKRTIECIEATFPASQFAIAHHKCSRLIGEVSGEWSGGDPVEGRKHGSEVDRVTWLMNQGNRLRQLSPNSDTVALLATQAISRSREGADGVYTPKRRVHVVDSLKHSSEVLRLREVYGSAFYCISLYAPRPKRLLWLEQDDKLTEEQAVVLVCRDEKEGEGHQQETTKAFQHGDVFLEVDDQGGETKTLRRFLELILMHPHHTPTPEEHGMFAAYSAAMKSGSLSRQVGAAITTVDGELVATGCNDAPSSGGGQYWTGADDCRDSSLGNDSNDTHKKQLIESIMSALAPNVSPAERYRVGKEKLAPTGILDLTEYGRDVHAEMAALLSAARRGVATKGTRLFTTTYPCHNCAKHIIAAGVEEVFYVEPYPKSKARMLHSDALTLDGEKTPGKVRLRAFEGIGPRRYFDLFSLSLGSGVPKHRKSDGKALRYVPTGEVRTPGDISSIIQKESRAASLLSGYLSTKDPETDELTTPLGKAEI